MSMRLMVEVMQTKVGNSGRKLVLLKLADNANDDGECFPSYQTIAKHCEMDRRTVIRHIAMLEKMGFLKVENRKRSNHDGEYIINSSNIYRLTIGSGDLSLGGDDVTLGSDNMPLGSGNLSPGGSGDLSLGGGKMSPITSQVTSQSSESDKEHNNEPRASDKSPAGDSSKKGKAKKEKKPEIEINIKFDVFWDAYDKKVGSRANIEKKWIALTDEIRTRIMEHIKLYVISTPDKKYRKNPETYLNQKAWENEIILHGANLATGNFSGYAKLSDTPYQDIEERVAQRERERRMAAAKAVGDVQSTSPQLDNMELF